MCSKTTAMMTRRKTKNASSLSSSTATTTTTTTTTTLTPTVSRKSKTASTTSKSSRKSRKSKTKTRKKKFISLLTHLSQPNSPNSPDSCDTNTTNHQLNLFPLHPENQEENVACFFEGDDGASLNEFIWIGGEEEDSLSPSLTYGYSEDCGVSSLERTALRHHEERDPSEEKWVCYSEVVEKKVKEEVKVKEEEDEMSCSVPEYWNTSRDHSNPTVGKLLLKLDYQEIMNAWSDKGPLYIDGGDCASQVVPDIFDEAGIAYDHRPKVKVEYGEVPIMRVSDDGSTGMEGGVDGSGEGWKVRHREASVLRYKRKRQNRLFSKRIRYEVRKLNAEKRPRLKGRFVKRN